MKNKLGKIGEKLGLVVTIIYFGSLVVLAILGLSFDALYWRVFLSLLGFLVFVGTFFLVGGVVSHLLRSRFRNKISTAFASFAAFVVIAIYSAMLEGETELFFRTAGLWQEGVLKGVVGAVLAFVFWPLAEKK